MNEPRDPGIDERLSDWVDGRLSSRDLERFEAELRVNHALRAQAEEYRRTVLAVRAALSGDGPRVDVVGRVLAAVQHGRIARPAAATAAATGGRRPQWWAFAASAIVGAAAIVMIALLIDWQGAGRGADKDGGSGMHDDVAKAPPPALFRGFLDKEREGQHKAEADPQRGRGEQDRSASDLTTAAAVESQDRDAGRVRLDSRRNVEQVEEQQAQKPAETFAERKSDVGERAVTGQPPAARPAPEPAAAGAGERSALQQTSKPEDLKKGDGSAKTAVEKELKQRTKDVEAGRPGEVPPARAPAPTGEDEREALRREVVTQIVLSPARAPSGPEDRSRGLADRKPFDLQTVAQGLRMQALTGVPVRAADVQQLVAGSTGDKLDVDKGGADKSVAGNTPADKAGAQKAEPEKNDKGGELARGFADRGVGAAWLVDGSPQEIKAFLARLGDAARRSGLDLQNGEADAVSVLALLPVQPEPDQAKLEVLQKDVEREQAAGQEKAKSAPADGPTTGGHPSTPTPPAGRGAPARVRLVIVLRH